MANEKTQVELRDKTVMVEDIPKDLTVYAARELYKTGRVTVVPDASAKHEGKAVAQFHMTLRWPFFEFFKDVDPNPPPEAK